MGFQFESLNDFLVMDGHGVYVWASYVVTAIALTLLVLIPSVKRRQLLIRLQRQQRIDEGQQPRDEAH